MTQILTLYTEYYSTMRTKYPDDPRYTNYTDAYFEAFHQQLLQSVEEMASSTGFAEYMIPATLAEEELKALQQIDPNFPVPECIDSSVTISEEILATLQETGKKLTVIMTNEEKPIYAISFDGAQIVDYYSVTLPKGHGFADGNAKLALLSGNPLPAGTTVRIYGENLGFLDTDKLVLWARDELGNWTEGGLLVNEDGLIEIPLKDGKELLIRKQGADLPSVEADPDEIPPTGDPLGHVFVILIIAAAAALVIMAQKKRFAK